MRDGPPHRPPAPATLHDVARAAGVSVSTASRALNGSSRTVTGDYLSRVRAAAARLNYAPHLSAQAIARGSTRTAALVVSDIADPYFSSIAAGVLHRAEAADLTVTMAITDRSPERELQIVRTLRGQRPHTIILAGSRSEETGTRAALVRELTAYRRAGGRVVLISQPELPFPTVSIDNAGGARDLALALVDRGYRRFAIIHGPDALRTSRDRVDGFLAGLPAGAPPPLTLETAFTREGGYHAATRLAKRRRGDVELAFAVNDVMAIGAMSALRDTGVAPGTGIAVAGFDDITQARDVTPPLTSVAVPLQEIGGYAMDLALSGEERTDLSPVAGTVVLRASTPGPRATT
ncbi:MAG TPA: LacI family DNA-binding transcriptional regulator [Rugosimonospora sp.]|nr:LacI family DNA-binding transcriptional regulator [Rugosimonospora sp.]